MYQITIPVRRRALLFDKRSLAGIAAHDVLVVGDTSCLCRFVCVFVNGRNALPTGEPCSLPDGSLFYIGDTTAEKRSSPISLVLILTAIFCRSARTPFLPGGALPAFCSLWCAECGTSPENISRSDGHEVFKVQMRLQDYSIEKYSSLPYIQEVGKCAEKRRFPRLWIGMRREGNEGRMPCR